MGCVFTIVIRAFSFHWLNSPQSFLCGQPAQSLSQLCAVLYWPCIIMPVLTQNQLSVASVGRTSVPTRPSACQRHHWFSSLRPLEQPFSAPPICRKPLALISWCPRKSLNKQLFSEPPSSIKTLNTQIALMNAEEAINHSSSFVYRNWGITETHLLRIRSTNQPDSCKMETEYNSKQSESALPLQTFL